MYKQEVGSLMELKVPPAIIFDLTVYASMNIFSLKLVIADILWGMFLSGAVAASTVFTINKIN